jgi:hypothetical protein
MRVTVTIDIVDFEFDGQASKAGRLLASLAGFGAHGACVKLRTA